MKVSLSRQESRDRKSSNAQKKSIYTNSLIYKQITGQMEQMFGKNNKPSQLRQKDIRINQIEDKDKVINKKGSINTIKKKNSKINISNNENVSTMKMIDNFIKDPTPTPNQQARLPGFLSKKNSTNSTKMKFKLDNKLIEVQQYQLQKKLFNYDFIIGKGGFGKVWKVQHNKTRNQYAMKEMLKSIVMTKKSVKSVVNQRILLSQLNSQFLVNMHYAFQDRDTLYLVLDLMQGGDLRYHICNNTFNQIQTKFFIASILLGLEHCHYNQIIHRDIKPENLVLDSRGYIRITDFGIARVYRNNNSSDTSGTPGYMSPEVICRQNHSYVSDYFAVGVIAYELMTGKRPYNGRSRNQIRDCMLAKQVQIKSHQLPEDWSSQALDFINRMIQRKPQNRLGFHSISEIKGHPWISSLNWEKLYNKQIQSPFIPMMRKKNFDQDEQITIEDEEQMQLIEKNALLLRKPQFQELFNGYYFDGNENKKVYKQPPQPLHQQYQPIKLLSGYRHSQNIRKETKDISSNYNNQKPRQKNSQQLHLKKKSDQQSTLLYSKDNIGVLKNLQTMQTMSKQRKKIDHHAQRSFFKQFKF